MISSLLGIGFSQTWFAATGKTPDEAVQTLELLRPKLHELEKEGFISRPVMVPLRSLDVQEKALAAMKAAEPSMTAKLAPPCEGSGCTPYGTVKLASWLAGPLGDNYRSLVARTSEGVVILVPVTLSAGKDAAAAAAAAAAGIDGVYWLNRRADFGSSSRPSARSYGAHRRRTRRARTHAREALWRKAWLVASLPVAGGLLAGLAAAGITGTPVNLFSLFALILVMGIGVDYTIFFHSEEGAGSADEPRDHVLHAMAVALGSTLLSLGILVLSETPAVRSFGLVLSAGVLFAFLLAPATRLITRRNTYREERPR
ncbi:MAG: MMPL family transporter [Sutterella wadsworthensis]